MDICGFENYKIHRNGDVENVKTNKILKAFTNNMGYLNVGLCKDGKVTNMRIHRLIALHFIPNLDNKKCVDHIDRNKQNNNIDNLRWVTCSENQLNTAIRGKSKYRGVSFHKQTNKWRAHIRIDSKIKHIGLYETEIEAAKAYNNFILTNDLNQFYRANLNVFEENEFFEHFIL